MRTCSNPFPLCSFCNKPVIDEYVKLPKHLLSLVCLKENNPNDTDDDEETEIKCKHCAKMIPSCCMTAHRKLCNLKIFKVTQFAFLNFDFRQRNCTSFLKCEDCGKTYKQSRPHHPKPSFVKSIHVCGVST